MNKNKKLLQGIILMMTTLALVCIAAFSGADPAETPEDIKVVASQNGKAGIVASLEQTGNKALDDAQLANLTVEKTETAVVTVASKSEAEAAQQKQTEKKAEETLSKTELEWQDKVMADVDDFLCIRAKGNSDSEILGKLYPTSVATIVKEGKEWTKVKSGDVKGYVKNDYLIYGLKAYENAKKVCKKYAYVQTDGLRVRSEADEEAKVLSVADKGDRLLFNKDADKKDGWVAVTVKAGDGYVSEEFVKVKLGTTEAVSIEEEIAAQKAKVAAQNSPMSASVDDITLLAAIIQCEAGNEPYEGQVAVGAVVLNRVRSGRWPNSISGVIYQRGQFGPTRNGALARVLSNGNISGSCKNAAAEALAGSDPTGGKMFFHRVNGRDGLVIGNHVFF